MSSRRRVFKAADLLLRDENGRPNKEAMSVFNETYQNARLDGCCVQLAAEIAMKKSLGI